MSEVATDAPVTGRLDAAGRLIAADPAWRRSGELRR